MRILGIDPGLATVGIGLVDMATGEKLQVVEWLTITSPKGLPLGERLKEIHGDLCAYLDSSKPDLVVMERLFFATNQKTALDVAHARGALLLAVASRGILLMEPTPLQLKLGITGDGKAEKNQVMQMVMQMLKLTEIPRPDDAADALGLAAYGALLHRQHVLTH